MYADFFLGVLGIVFESSDATLVAFGDITYDKAIGVAEAACIVISVVMFFFFFLFISLFGFVLVFVFVLLCYSFGFVYSGARRPASRQLNNQEKELQYEQPVSNKIK